VKLLCVFEITEVEKVSSVMSIYCLLICSVERTTEENMASSAKRLKTEEDECVSGYLQGLSPVKLSKKNARYFDATFQNGREEYHRVVVFTPERRRQFEQAVIAKKPVKLTKVKKTNK